MSSDPDELDPSGYLGCEVEGADPDRLREVFGDAEYVGLGPARSLRLFSVSEVRKMAEYCEKAPQEKARAYSLLLVHVTRLEEEETGRFVLPDRLCAYAGLREGPAVLAEGDDGSMFLCAPEGLDALEEMLRQRRKTN